LERQGLRLKERIEKKSCRLAIFRRQSRIHEQGGRMNHSKWFLVGVLIVLSCCPLFAQQPAAKRDTSSKFRTVGTIAGAGGGFALGVFAGIAKFDDAVNSDRKVWTTAIIGSAAGGVGGYFIGRIFDRRRDRADLLGPQRTVHVSPLLSNRAKGVHLTISF
jgi:hypothetical protein